jgi:hypothetical protein
MNKILLFIIAAAVFALSACTSIQYVPSRLGYTYPVRTAPAAIELFRSSSPTKKYIEIGAVSGCCSTDANVIIEMLRKKASENGGDALIGLDMRANGGISASVIRYE